MQNAIQKYISQRRRGSLLILVIVILVLLALIGTAFIATARSDRYSTQQASTNARGDQIIDGVKRIAVQALVDDLYGVTAAAPTFRVYRPASDSVNLYTYTNLDSLGAGSDPATAPGDTFLSSRVPESTGLGIAPMWRYITGPLIGVDFESPVDGTKFPIVNGIAKRNLMRPTSQNGYPALNLGGLDTTYVASDADGDGIADSGLMKLPMGKVDGITYYVGIRIIDDNSAINVNTAWSKTTDYDGNGNLNVRNNLLTPASIGLVEAMFGATATTPATSAEFGTLQQNYKFNGAWQDLNVPIGDTGFHRTSSNTVSSSPDFTFSSLQDALWNQMGRRLANPGYVTGDTTGDPNTTPNYNAKRYQALTWSEGTALKYGFCLMNPDQYNTGSTDKVLDTLLPNSLTKYYSGAPVGGSPIRTSAYGAGQAATWFTQLFDYDGLYSGDTASYRPIRSLLVTRNPVSQAISPRTAATDLDGNGLTDDPAVVSQLMTANGWANTYGPQGMLPYNTGDKYQFNGAAGNFKAGVAYTPGMVVQRISDGGNSQNTPLNYGAWVCLANNTGQLANGTAASLVTEYGLPAGNSRNAQPDQPSCAQIFWRYQPWTKAPMKASLLNGQFAELWRAFWCVMCDTSGTTAFGTTDPGPTAVYTGSAFDPTTFQPLPLATPGVQHPQRMFRSSIRSPMTTNNTYFPPDQEMLLRAAIAAVNTEDLRDPDDEITGRQIRLKATVNGAANTPVDVVVYGNEPQVFITEIYANTDVTARTVWNGTAAVPLTNPKGYVAIELYNPTKKAIEFGRQSATNANPVSGANGGDGWALAVIDRTPTGGFPNLSMKLIGGLGTTSLSGTFPPVKLPTPTAAPNNNTLPTTPFYFSIPPGGTVVLENYGAPPVTTPAAAYRPPSSNLPPYGAIPGVVSIYVENLDQAIGKELVVLKRRNADHHITSNWGRTVQSSDTGEQKRIYDWSEVRPDGSYRFSDNTALPSDATSSHLFTANANFLCDMVPIDSFDFTNLATLPLVPTTATVWHYARVCDPAAGMGWRCVYPGRYDGSVSTPGAGRQQGTQTATFIPPAPDPWNPVAYTAAPGLPPVPGVSLGAVMLTDTTWGASPAVGTTATYPTTFPIQLAQAFPAPSLLITGNKFPFGNFPRNGDAMSIPFIGAYRVTLAANFNAAGVSGDMIKTPATFLELNTISMDAAMAEDTDTADDATENIGRFAPIGDPVAATFDWAVPAANPDPNAHYRFAFKLFDYLTVQAPYNDNFANTEMARYMAAGGYGNQNFARNTPVYSNPESVARIFINGLADPDPSTEAFEDVVGVDGLININTAPVKVLEAVPFIRDNLADNKSLAQAIVDYRNLYGPFKTIWDLNRVPGFQTRLGLWTLATFDPDETEGDFTPVSAWPGAYPLVPGVTDKVVGDYEAYYLMMNRISNLITTRSDTFTVYINLEGWANAGDSVNAQRVSQRRAAFIVDRSGYTSDKNRLLKVINVPAP